MNHNRDVWGHFMIGIVFILVCLLMLSACANEGTDANSAGAETGKKSWDMPPMMKIQTDKKYEATLNTSKGSFTIELFAKDAPKTVNNFIFLAREGFYDKVTFHRIIESYMIQTGDPTGTGKGGPGYKFEDELDTPHKYEPGIVAMANSGPNTNTNGSQFFICTGEQCDMLNSYAYFTIFGKVSSGMETVLKIDATPVEIDPKSQDGVASLPTEKVTIDSITIR